MQTNLWNLKNSKQRFGIRERTQAHRRHLLSLVKVRSTLKNNKKQWRLKSLNAQYNKRVRESINRDNKNLLQRIEKVQTSQSSRVKIKQFTKYSEITDNIQAMCSQVRFNKVKEIQKENGKMFSRLINASSTLSSRCWANEIKQNEKYKLNMSRTKYSNPNYSDQVNKTTNNRKMTFKHLKLSRTEQTLPNLHDVSKISIIRA